MADPKKPTTINEQIEILKARNLSIKDEDMAKKVLSSINYYNFSGYLFTHENKNGEYENISFENVYDTYLCDKRMRSIILYAIEIIEHHLKTKISYVLAHETGSIAYLNSEHFKNKAEHTRFVEKFNNNIESNKHLPFVKHHIIKYNSQFPIWVAVELCTLGMLSHLYKNLKTPLQKKIAKEFHIGVSYICSWLECVRYIRNISAHSMRIYRLHMTESPKKSKLHNNYINSKMAFDILHTMKFLMPDSHEWNNYIVPTILHVLTEYSDSVSPMDYGFPDDWYNLLIL